MSQFGDENFNKTGTGKGKWEIVYGGISEKIKYENENFINEKQTIGYCKIARQDGGIAHVFISKLPDGKEIVTTTGMQEAKAEIGKTLLNSLPPLADLETHYQSHLKQMGSQTPIPDKKYLEKQLKDLPETVFELGKKAVMQKMGL
ncbi:MAG TPA: hypothetical protein DHW82_03100 [Spirochaetia bacterium]|nr:MAG: hypothetical protein A2Y41_04000 [Spirochaetes bacterium GWB1_36_13]HCL55979.1 hypothetical protein [Spirochaetia bacterium]